MMTWAQSLQVEISGGRTRSAPVRVSVRAVLTSEGFLVRGFQVPAFSYALMRCLTTVLTALQGTC